MATEGQLCVSAATSPSRYGTLRIRIFALRVEARNWWFWEYPSSSLMIFLVEIRVRLNCLRDGRTSSSESDESRWWDINSVQSSQSSENFLSSINCVTMSFFMLIRRFKNHSKVKKLTLKMNRENKYYSAGYPVLKGGMQPHTRTYSHNGD